MVVASDVPIDVDELDRISAQDDLGLVLAWALSLVGIKMCLVRSTRELCAVWLRRESKIRTVATAVTCTRIFGLVLSPYHAVLCDELGTDATLINKLSGRKGGQSDGGKSANQQSSRGAFFISARILPSRNTSDPAGGPSLIPSRYRQNMDNCYLVACAARVKSD